jgi:hypothetical protein
MSMHVYGRFSLPRPCLPAIMIAEDPAGGNFKSSMTSAPGLGHGPRGAAVCTAARQHDGANQTRKSPGPIPRRSPIIPDLAGKRGGNPRFPTRPESGNGGPISRSGNGGSPFPDSAGNGKRAGNTEGIPVSKPRTESGSRGRRAGDFLVWRKCW